MMLAVLNKRPCLSVRWSSLLRLHHLLSSVLALQLGPPRYSNTDGKSPDVGPPCHMRHRALVAWWPPEVQQLPPPCLWYCDNLLEVELGPSIVSSCNCCLMTFLAGEREGSYVGNVWNLSFEDNNGTHLIIARSDA